MNHILNGDNNSGMPNNQEQNNQNNMDWSNIFSTAINAGANMANNAMNNKTQRYVAEQNANAGYQTISNNGSLIPNSNPYYYQQQNTNNSNTNNSTVNNKTLMYVLIGAVALVGVAFVLKD